MARDPPAVVLLIALFGWTLSSARHAVQESPATLSRPALVATEAYGLVAPELVPLLLEREADSSWKARFEALASEWLRLPTGFAFELTGKGLVRREDTSMALGSLVHSDLPQGFLRFHFALDLDWILVGGAFFIAQRPRSAFSRTQQSERLYYPSTAIPDALAALVGAQTSLREQGIRVQSLWVGTGETTGEEPFLRIATHVVLGAEEPLAGSTAAPLDELPAHIHGILPLPVSAARVRDSDAGERARRGGGDLVIGPVTTKRTLGEGVEAIRSARISLSSLPGRLHSPTSPSGDLVTFSQLLPTPGGTDAMFHFALTSPAAETPVEVIWGSTGVALEQTKAALEAASAFAIKHDEQLAIAAVFPPEEGSSFRCVVVIATTPTDQHYLEATSGHLLEIQFSLGSDPIRTRELGPTDVRVSCAFGSLFKWRAAIVGGGVFSTARDFDWCGVGKQWPPEARYIEKVGTLVGGTTFLVGRPGR